MKYKDFELKKTPHRESPPIEVRYDVCRECRHLQPCVALRGWHVCYGCLSQLDNLFCTWRAQAQMAELQMASRVHREAANVAVTALDKKDVDGEIGETSVKRARIHECAKHGTTEFTEPDRNHDSYCKKCLGGMR